MSTVALSEISSLAYSKLGSNTRMYTASEVYRAINNALKITNLFGSWQSKTVDARPGFTVAGRIMYRVPESIVFPEKVTYEGMELDKVGLHHRCKEYPDWMSESTSSTGGPVARWCPYSLNKFLIHPADSVGGGQLLVTGLACPDDMAHSTDTVSIPRNVATTVAEYAAHIVQCKLTGTPFTQSMPMYRAYEKYIKQQRAYLTYKHPNLWFDIKQPE